MVELVESVSFASSMHGNLGEHDLALFRTRVCERHRQGNCFIADKCPNSHCQTWQRRNPKEYTYSPKLCPEIEFIKRGSKMTLVRRCGRGRGCMFAHSKEEELYHPNMYKTKFCNSHPWCTRYFCPFAHSPEELRKKRSPSREPAAVSKPKRRSVGSKQANNKSSKVTKKTGCSDKSKKQRPGSPVSSSTCASNTASPAILSSFMEQQPGQTKDVNNFVVSSSSNNNNIGGGANNNKDGAIIIMPFPNNTTNTCNQNKIWPNDQSLQDIRRLSLQGHQRADQSIDHCPSWQQPCFPTIDNSQIITASQDMSANNQNLGQPNVRDIMMPNTYANQESLGQHHIHGHLEQNNNVQNNLGSVWTLQPNGTSLLSTSSTAHINDNNSSEISAEAYRNLLVAVLGDSNQAGPTLDTNPMFIHNNGQQPINGYENIERRPFEGLSCYPAINWNMPDGDHITEKNCNNSSNIINNNNTLLTTTTNTTTQPIVKDESSAMRGYLPNVPDAHGRPAKEEDAALELLLSHLAESLSTTESPDGGCRRINSTIAPPNLIMFNSSYNNSTNNNRTGSSIAVQGGHHGFSDQNIEGGSTDGGGVLSSHWSDSTLASFSFLKSLASAENEELLLQDNFQQTVGSSMGLNNRRNSTSVSSSSDSSTTTSGQEYNNTAAAPEKRNYNNNSGSSSVMRLLPPGDSQRSSAAVIVEGPQHGGYDDVYHHDNIDSNNRSPITTAPVVDGGENAKTTTTNNNTADPLLILSTLGLIDRPDEGWASSYNNNDANTQVLFPSLLSSVPFGSSYLKSDQLRQINDYGVVLPTTTTTGAKLDGAGLNFQRG